MNKKTNIIIGGLLVSLGIILGILGTTISFNMKDKASTTNPQETISDYLSEVIGEYSYFYENEDLLLDGALKGMVESLNDPYSVYLSSDDYQKITNEFEGNLVGIGITLASNGPYPIITSVIHNSPADIAGIEVGEVIKAVDNIDVYNKPIGDIANLIKGIKGTIREISVSKIDPEVIYDVNITLDEIYQKSVEYRYENINNQKIGYLKINSFRENTYSELTTAMEHLENKNIDDLIIDVRGNPGGLLSSVTDILDYFINTDKAFMYSTSRTGEEKAYYIENNSHEINYNIVVLMDEHSASAAEIFASSMNELGGYQLIGQTTYGKGTMQSFFPLNITGTRWVKLTTNIWKTSKNEWIGNIGVEPTIVVLQTKFLGLDFINPTEIYSIDDVNQEIKEVQLFLNKKGFTIREDGYFDKDTENAIKAYQTTKEINASGELDANTIYYLNLDILNYLNDNNNDVQYDKAKDYVINN